MRHKISLVILALTICFGADQPKYKTIPAARTSELTPSRAQVAAEHNTWYRSHGDAASSRYSSLRQINRDNVALLRIAWIYHSADGKGNLECNPIIVAGVIYAPTAGNHIVAIDGATGK